MPPTTLAEWSRWRADGCTRLPLMLTCAEEVLPASWQGFADQPVSVLLESASGGRYTFFCDRPERVVQGWAERAEIHSPDGARSLEERVGSPLSVIATLLKERKTPPRLDGAPPMIGGWFGLFGYDLVRTWERLPAKAVREETLPLYALIEPRDLFVYDQRERTLRVIVWSTVDEVDADSILGRYRVALQWAEQAWQRWRTGGEGGVGERLVREETATTKVPPPSFTRAEFEAAVQQVHGYLADGHTYQTNLSLRQSRAAPARATVVYEALRRVNPSPYMGLWRMPAFSLVCGSPELLVRLVDSVIESRPIAGTRPRGADALGDSEFSAELLANAKERAEHLMLVDLIRNDIGRVAEAGSVRVREYMAVERYSHVMHLVSQVEGRLAAGKDWADVLRSMFPGGTITGCPKVRTMEIIEELEPIGRQFYTGSLGWISYAGEMELNIIIRSMLLHQGVAHVQAGAGIVADSQPEREFDEAMHKARALWVAWEQAVQHG